MNLRPAAGDKPKKTLEIQLESQLHLPREIGLVRRHETEIREIRATRGIVRGTENRRVEDVKRLKPELSVNAFREIESLV